jgi:hypothetical protein
MFGSAGGICTQRCYRDRIADETYSLTALNRFLSKSHKLGILSILNFWSLRGDLHSQGRIILSDMLLLISLSATQRFSMAMQTN